MRLIDADKIKLPQGFFEKVDNVPKFYEWLDNQPTVDAVEVVRCKDCKHYLRNKIHVIEGIPLMCNEVCEKWGGGCRTDENGFCYMGERSEE